MHVNARSTANKVEDVEQTLLVHCPDVMVVAKTWRSSGIRNEEICPPYYDITIHD